MIVLLFLNSFLLVRHLRDTHSAAIATLSLFLVYEVSWLFLQDRTHNILVTVLAPLVCLSFLIMVNTRTMLSYMGFGVMFALSTLAKPSGIYLPLMLCLAALTVPAYRSAMVNRNSLISLGSALILLAGPLYWAATHQVVVLGSTVKFNGNGWINGLSDYAVGFAELFAFPALVFGLTILLTKPGPPLKAPENLLLRGFALAALLIVPIIIFANVGNILGRWLLPVFVPAVPLLFAWAFARTGIFRWLPSWMGGAVFAASVILYPGHMAEIQEFTSQDIQSYADTLRNHEADIVIGDHKILGNVALIAPDLQIHDKNNPQIHTCGQNAVLVDRGLVPETKSNLRKRIPACQLQFRGSEIYIDPARNIWIMDIELREKP